MTEPSASTRPTGWALVPPPVLFVGAFAIGVLLAKAFPLVMIRSSTPLRWIGIVLVIVGALHALTSVSLFARARTTVVPHHVSSVLVTSGAYRWTRNPMYVGLTLMYLGAAAFMATLWPVLLLIVPLMVLDRRIIPMEERQLEERFGASYREYTSRVRRWV